MTSAAPRPEISMNGFAGEPAALRSAMRAAYDRVLASNHFVLGDEVAAFEREWAETLGAEDSVGVANGLDAIEIALRSLGIGAGDEVVTTPMTAFATVLAILRAGATPVLADIDPATALLSPESVERCIGPRTRAVLLVHLYGQVRDMARWKELTSRYGIVLIEDCAQAHLATENGTAAGTFAPVSAFSFYPTKNLGAVGDAGAVVTNSTELAMSARRLRNYGQANRYEHPVLGMNSRLDELQAALLRERLKWLADFTARRREIAERYRTGIERIDSDLVHLLASPTEPAAHVHHLFVVTSPRRDELAAHLLAAGVQTLIHYPIPVHRQQPCADAARDPAGLTAADVHAATCLSLPCHPALTDSEVDRVLDALASFGPSAGAGV